MNRHFTLLALLALSHSALAWPKCNSTLENASIDSEIPIWHTWTFHHIGLWLSAIFGIVAIAVSFFLIAMHAVHYSRPYEQKHIIRILFMVPVYAAVSFLSYLYYKHTVYFEVLRDCYEAFAIASFFSLMCAYLSEDIHGQKQYFRTIQPKRWVWPLPWIQKCWGGESGPWRTPRSGLTWFNVVWVGIFQYCFIRVFFTIVSVITQAVGLYCLESLNPAFSHVWVMVIESVGVTIAMYCLIQFYVQIRHDVAEHKPLLKVCAIKLVIFLSFWQTLAISFLTSAGAIKPTNKILTPDIKVGIPAMLLCIEMALFAIFHLFAFGWKEYKIQNNQVPDESVDARPEYQGGWLGTRAMLEAANPWDMIKAVGRGARWLFVGRKTRMNDPSYAISRVDTQTSSDPAKYPAPMLYESQVKRKPSARGQNHTFPDSEGDTLLPNAQAMPLSQPHTAGIVDEEAGRFNTRNDYGLPKPTYDEGDYEADQSSYQQPQAYPYSNQATWRQPAPPYPSSPDDANWGGREDPALSYPQPHYDPKGQHDAY